MAQRNVAVRDVRNVVEHGETIEEYPDDQPYPSRLMLGWSSDRPLHVVAAEDVDANRVYVITVYEPDPARWTEDFKERINR